MSIPGVDRRGQNHSRKTKPQFQSAGHSLQAARNLLLSGSAGSCQLKGLSMVFLLRSLPTGYVRHKETLRRRSRNITAFGSDLPVEVDAFLLSHRVAGISGGSTTNKCLKIQSADRREFSNRYWVWQPPAQHPGSAEKKHEVRTCIVPLVLTQFYHWIVCRCSTMYRTIWSC